MQLKTETLELRGIKDFISSKGNIYYMVYCEQADTEPVKFYCASEKVFPTSPKLKKGDIIRVHLDYVEKFKTLVVERIELVNKGE